MTWRDYLIVLLVSIGIVLAVDVVNQRHEINSAQLEINSNRTDIVHIAQTAQSRQIEGDRIRTQVAIIATRTPTP